MLHSAQKILGTTDQEEIIAWAEEVLFQLDNLNNTKVPDNEVWAEEINNTFINSK